MNEQFSPIETVANDNGRKSKNDPYQEVTNQIIAMLHDGVRPWSNAWHKHGMPTRSTGEHYRGINVLLLDMARMSGDFDHHVWMTYKQAQALGGQVLKGSKSTRIYKTGTFQKAVLDAQGQPTDEKETVNSRYLKRYSVFNIDQIEGINRTDFIRDENTPVLSDEERDAASDQFFTRLNGNLETDENRCFYRPSTDTLHMVPFEQFVSGDRYYSVLAHEYTHWTMHPTRLDRPVFKKLRSTTDYANEELVAELGAAFLCRHLGLSAEPREDHAAYIKSWLSVLRNDNRAIFRAAANAQKASDFLISLAGTSPDAD